MLNVTIAPNVTILNRYSNANLSIIYVPLVCISVFFFLYILSLSISSFIENRFDEVKW